MDGVLPHPAVCEQARLSRDPRFDGLFFTAVRSTGIYCRPTCPAPPPKAANVTYFPSAAAAEAAGYRPCLRCRPELSPAEGSWRRGDDVVARALKLIDEGFLADRPVSALAGRLHVGERHLRRLFVERLGAPPTGVHGTRRLLFAKQLLTETSLPVTEVALAAGFGSLRRFNAAFRTAYGMTPRDLRRNRPDVPGGALVLRLGYRPPFDFAAALGFLRARALPGVEHVDGGSYVRAIADPASPGWLRVSAADDGSHALRLELHGVEPAALPGVVRRVRRMFDLDADPAAIAGVLSRDPVLHPLVRARPGLRLPGGWDGFEVAVRAVIGQQVSVASARTLVSRVAERYGTPLPPGFASVGLRHAFPGPEVLADAGLEAVGLTTARARTIRAIARALADGHVDFSPERTLDDFVECWTALPGIGAWTAQYIAMRALGHPDAFPAGDLVLRRRLSGGGGRITEKAALARAEAWHPWRAYATIQLWNDAASAAREASRGTAGARGRPARRKAA